MALSRRDCLLFLSRMLGGEWQSAFLPELCTEYSNIILLGLPFHAQNFSTEIPRHD
jgi:hypothetical protein